MFYVLALMAAASRLLPHPPNFAPIGALGLFAGAYGSRRGAWTVPLAALLASDAVLGFYHPLLMAFVYMGFAAGGLLGRAFLREGREPWKVAACSLASAVVFFLLSNFGVWLVGAHAHTAAGLARTYLVAIPFFRWTVLGDLTYAALLFGMYEAAAAWAARRRAARAAS